uniref:GDSL esterase/lipase n=1 Tax=Cannabis sativa TaxID=3483 RepID=A0A803QHE1_CANSA
MAVLKKNIREEGIIFIMSITVLIMMIMLHEAKGDEEHPQVPCFFIFGDSLVDNGNNNQLETIIKVNNKPYGIDFPGGIATGRFSNGRNVVDIIGEALGFKTFIPPFASVLNGNAALITRGVNYGSGGSGIRNDTGKIVGTLLNLEAQVNHHLMTVAKIKSMLGINEGEAHLNKCIYFVGMGGSDYLTNYFLPDVQSTSRDYAPQQYARVLIEEYKVQILSGKRFPVKKLSENCENSSNWNKGTLEGAKVDGRVGKQSNGGLRNKKVNRRRTQIVLDALNRRLQPSQKNQKKSFKLGLEESIGFLNE